MVYIVEDDDSIRELITYTLNSQGMEAKSFARPSEFYEGMKQGLPNLILLDIMLPEEDGLSILKKLKADRETKTLPVIMLTAKGSEYDTVLGLDSGADDYVAKPFRMMELLSRIRALMRRAGDQVQEEEREEYTLGSLYVCPSRHVVSVNGENITLTLKEFELLCLMMEHREMVFSRAQLLDKVWGYSFDGESRTVDVHIRTLRQKLGEAGSLIETVRGVGYKIGGEKK
ncbi:response regulator transcription factor [Clostridium sp. AM58-1XD]|uniref:response regulator transcription factor n=1 Tax=Clostridium sp. AM58-1XD TaxID=2292307 RepID=UPI000E495F47|nr:response regulator transcription factor [Clostridium sp. AM58-1XD]RGY98246.1 DNA-binding response regulator [Clostridium sp. AM58-1XD]